VEEHGTRQLAKQESTHAQPEDADDRSRLVKWGAVLLIGFGVWLCPIPSGIEPKAWLLFAIFVTTIIGSILRPIPGGAMVLIGISALALTGVMSIKDALTGYADPIVWLVLAAFFMARGMIKTGLGRRIAFLLIRAIGKHSLGLGYALISTDLMLAMVIPSTGARAGGIVFPVAKSLAEAYDSRPGETARRLGAFLMPLLSQCDIILCAMFLTGQASNPLIAKFAHQVTGIQLSYGSWALAAAVPGLISLAVVPYALYRVFPPEIKHTPAAADFAKAELTAMGKMSRGEWLMLLTFGMVAILWMTTALHALDYAVVALLGICGLLVTGVLTWRDVVSEYPAWDVFIWYGGLVRMAAALGETGIIKGFADFAATLTLGWIWWAALAILILIYFYAHYGFASITAHVTVMYIPFLVVVLAAGAPPYLAVLSLAYASNLDASLTHYGTTSVPIFFGAGYVKQRTWWFLGLIVSLITISIWTIFGLAWWKVLNLW
jgi:DASS family divalent anion:Na+ symporter